MLVTLVADDANKGLSCAAPPKEPRRSKMPGEEKKVRKRMLELLPGENLFGALQAVDASPALYHRQELSRPP